MSDSGDAVVSVGVVLCGLAWMLGHDVQATEALTLAAMAAVGYLRDVVRRGSPDG